MKLKLVLFFGLLTIAHARFVKRIIGGSDAQRGSFPNVVAVYGFRPTTGNRMGYLYCGGTIYNVNWILVTGFCASEINRTVQIDNIRVLAGKWNLTRAEPSMQMKRIVLSLKHDGYDPIEIGRSINLGLLKLQTPLVFNQYISAFPVSTNFTYPSGNAVIVGWGSMSHEQANKSELAEILQVLNVHVMNLDQCNDTIQLLSILDGDMFIPTSFDELHFCSEPYTWILRGPSYGDGGGPVLQLNANNQYNVVGIITAGVGELGLGVHLHLPPLVPWIEAEIAKFPDLQI